MADRDGDGFDDETGEPVSGPRRDASGNWVVTAHPDDPSMPGAAGDTDPYRDNDGDGFDDDTGLSQDEYEAARIQRQRDRDALSNETLARQQRDRESAATRAADRARRDAAAYWESGEGQRDLDEGRAPRYPRDPDAAAEAAYTESMGAWGGGGGGGGAGGGGTDDRPAWLRDMDSATADIPIAGWILGSAAREGASEEERRRAANIGLWADLMGRAPSAEDLMVDYGQEAFIGGPEQSELAGAYADEQSIEAQRAALQGLQDMGRGLTSADRARMALAQQEIGRQTRSMREADMAALQARGMGGSGAELMSMLGSQQYGADALAARDAQAQIAAQQRALQAMQAQGQLSSGMRGQSFEEEGTRRGAADDFMRWQTDYQRGRETRNVGLRGQTGESRSSARQQAYENRERGTAGMTDQYNADSAARQAEARRQDEQSQAFVSGLGDLFD